MTIIPERDSSGRAIIRTAATVKGWHYQALFFEYETSTGILFCEDCCGNDLSSLFNITRYDAAGLPTSVANTVVRDVITMVQPTDFEIISGNIRQLGVAPTDLRVFVTGGLYDENNNFDPIDTKEFVTGGLNLALVESVETDGRASKFMKHTTEGAPFPTNRLQYTFKHDAGFQKKVLVSTELFKP